MAVSYYATTYCKVVNTMYNCTIMLNNNYIFRILRNWFILSFSLETVLWSIYSKNFKYPILYQIKVKTLVYALNYCMVSVPGLFIAFNSNNTTIQLI